MPPEVELESELAGRFKAARARLGYSQTEVAALLKVSQRTISNYERGRPTPDVEQVAFLETRARELGQSSRLPMFRLGREIAEERLPPNYVKLYSDEEFFARLKTWVKEWETWAKRNNKKLSCDFHFLNPQSLPVWEKELARTTWSENLAHGISYHLYWFLSSNDQKTMKDNLQVLRRVVENAAPDKGPDETSQDSTLHFHAFRESDAAEVFEWYEEMRKEIKKVEGNGPKLIVEKCKIRKKITQLEEESPILVVRVSQALSDCGTPPQDFSAFQVELASSILLNPVSGWAYLPPGRTKGLLEQINGYLKADSSKNPAGKAERVK